MQKDNPEKLFIPATTQAVCSYMKMNTLEKVVQSLETLQPEVRVPAELASRAYRSIERMLAIV